ncbi:MAG: YgiQ family radical SAM protein [Anaerolineae bacterium]|nr:YgiQ family radical SAM protein [Anaerolineae bacterium]
MAFLPTTPQEIQALGWQQPDIILVTGDSYIDSPFIGVAVIGRMLEASGFRVAVIAQPDMTSPQDITRLGEPALFWGISGGSVDSMIANYTASKKRRKTDDYTPGGINNRRPDRAVIAYANLIRRYFKNTRPIVLGGIEASLRRIAHYDFWSNTIRRSILFDAKADYLLYGMAEQSVLEFARAIQTGVSPANVRGVCYISKQPPAHYLLLPPYETVAASPDNLIDMFHIFYRNNEPATAQGLCQQHGDRFLVQNPPAPYLPQTELDKIFALPFERAQHPYYETLGKVKALETIRFSISTHRGCYGECNFCAIAVHEGRTVRWRSMDSILKEAEILTHLPGFKGYILDVGGPTANMYGFECSKKIQQGACQDKRCLYPMICPSLNPDHTPQIEMLRRIRQIPGVKKVFVASGIRYDLVMTDQKQGGNYLRQIVNHHVSGQLKVAPEHNAAHVLQKMGKPPQDILLKFKKKFDQLSKESGKKQFLTYYLIAAHPGCTETDMQQLSRFASHELGIRPEQVQIFTPAPSTYSSIMYCTGLDPFTRQPLFVEKDPARRQHQKAILLRKPTPKTQKRSNLRPKTQKKKP